MRFALVLLLLCGGAQAEPWSGARLLEFTEASCRGWADSGAPAEGFARSSPQVTDLRRGEFVVGKRYRLELERYELLELDVFQRGERPARYVASWFSAFGDPLVLVSLASNCSLQGARRLEYNANGQALYAISLDADLQPTGDPDWMNPPLEFVERAAPVALKHPGDNTPVRVAMVDSGVNYRLEEINRRLARDADGRLVGYDFWEMDDLPYDAHPVSSGFFLQRHGTRTASLLLREAPKAELVPYRYPRPDMSRMHALVEHASEHGVGIVGLPLGSNRAEDWGSFARAARAHPEMLFISSAGNNGRDIDAVPVFPAVLNLDNLLVVTSAGDNVVPAEGVNWGRLSVDFLLPAERRLALDYSGKPRPVSGSSYAVARAVALAARIKAARRDLSPTQIIDEMQRRFGVVDVDLSDWVSRGYLADPLAGRSIVKTRMAGFEPELPPAGVFQLDTEIIRLDPRWSDARINAALREAFAILAQCDIGPGRVTAYQVEADDYLRDLDTGSARSLLEATASTRPTLVFARDTRLRDDFLGVAFGLGNTSLRPWLANSVWLMRDLHDDGIALAHELYHVLSNSGTHVRGEPNLMQAFTRPDSTALTAEQCRVAQQTGLAIGLLRRED